MAKNDFSIQLDEIRAPKAADASIFVQGVQQDHARRAQDIQMDHVENMQAIEAAGLGLKAGAAATSHLMTKSEEGEINEVLRNVEPAVETEIDANNLKQAQGLMDSFNSADFAGQQTVSHFTSEAAKFAEARRQGVITNEEAVARIGGIVKKYSAMVPGLASDFRKKAADLTGISNIDTYGIHKFLTEKGLRTKAAEKALEIDMQLTKEAASALGLTSISQLTPEAKGFYASTKQVAMQTQRAEGLKKTRDMVRDEADELNNGLVSQYVTEGMSGIAAEFAQLHAAHANSTTPITRDKALQLGGQLAGKLDVLEGQLVARINSLTVGKNPMRRETAEKRVADLRATMSHWKEAVKTSEGFNMWTQMVRSAEGDANALMNKITLANPMMAALGKWGIAQPLAQAWIALGDKEKFTRSFGKAAADAVEKALSEPNSYFAAADRVLTGGNPLAAEQDPGHKAVIYNDIVKFLEGQARDAGMLTDQQKGPMANATRNWLDNLDVTNPKELTKFAQFTNSDAFIDKFKQLDPMQRAQALEPMFTRIAQQVMPSHLADVTNGIAELKAAGIEGVTVTVDPLMGRLVLSVPPAKPQASPAMGTVALMRPIDSPANQQKLQAMQRRLDVLNAMPMALARMTPLVNPEAKPVPANILNQMQASITTGRPINVVASLIGGVGDTGDQNSRMASRDVPRNITATVVDDTVLNALGYAESSNNPDAVGDAGKAVGEFQMWEGAMEDAGFSPADRKDPVKAREAAAAYLGQQLKAFDGDMTKAIAAWNMGPGRFRKHLREHGDAWQESLPQATKTLLQRFNKGLGNGA